MMLAWEPQRLMLLSSFLVIDATHTEKCCFQLQVFKLQRGPGIEKEHFCKGMWVFGFWNFVVGQKRVLKVFDRWKNKEVRRQISRMRRINKWGEGGGVSFKQLGVLFSLFENCICLAWSVGDALCLLSSWAGPVSPGSLGFVTNSGSNSLLLVSFHSSEQFVKNHLIPFTLTFFGLGLWGRFRLTKKNTKVFWDLFSFFTLSISAVQSSLLGFLYIFWGILVSNWR